MQTQMKTMDQKNEKPQKNETTNLKLENSYANGPKRKN